MITNLTKKFISNWRIISLLIISSFCVIFSFIILVIQRSNISQNNNLDELLIILSLIFISLILFIFIRYIYRLLVPINKRKVKSFNNKFSIYFIGIALTPALIAGLLGLVLVNISIDDWFNKKIKSVINNSLNVAEGYIREHNNSIKSDVYAMSNDLNRNYQIYVSNRFKFEAYFERQSILRSLPEAYIVNGKGEVLMGKTASLFTQYFKPRKEALERAYNGELAIMTSTSVNKVYALIKLPNFIDSYLYIGKSLDPEVTKAFDETKSAVNEYSELEKNRAEIGIVFMFIYILAIIILVIISILFGLKFSNRIVKPINDVIDATKTIRKGNFNIQLGKTNDFIELNSLSDSFNTMSSELIVQRNLLSNAEKHAAWSEIAKTLAHEIKNPLTPIQLSADRLRKKIIESNLNDTSLIECIDVITRQVSDIGKLVNNFSDFARMPKPIFLLNDLNLIISNSVSVKLITCDNKIDINFNNKNLYLMKSDELQLTQVFNNILQNSINSIEDSGIKNGLIDVNTIMHNNIYSVLISDNGSGINNTQSEIIEPYFTTRKKMGGTGLGLSIVNKIITDHDGIFEINNNKEAGATVKITFNNINE
jgi:two-component system nitrogen regulation sensor histidine kinase NtrY